MYGFENIQICTLGQLILTVPYSFVFQGNTKYSFSNFHVVFYYIQVPVTGLCIENQAILQNGSHSVLVTILVAPIL